jgi:hypothetical protein
MQRINAFDFFALTFDDRGALPSRDEFKALVKHANATDTTDAIFIAHGFRNDAGEATSLHGNFLKTLKAHWARPEFASLASRRFVVAGIYWPSKAFRDTFDESDGKRGLRNPAEAMAEATIRLDDLKRDATPAQRARLEKAKKLLPRLEGNRTAQDEFVKLVLGVLNRSKLDATEGLPQIRKRRGSELLTRLAPGPVAGTRGLGNIFGSIAGGVGQFLNLTTWYVMKDRSGKVGATGAAEAVRALHASRREMRLHLVGHSLGGRLIAACTKALSDPPAVRPDSVMLLEAAFSHYGFSADNGHGQAGFFRDVVTPKVVKGPFVSTFSAQDTVVGRAYSVMSRLAGDNTREIGDASDEFGGIGRNGPQRTTEVAHSLLHAPGRSYTYKPGVINNLDGSGGLIKNHSDVTNSAITYAFASAVART